MYILTQNTDVFLCAHTDYHNLRPQFKPGLKLPRVALIKNATNLHNWRVIQLYIVVTE